MQEFTITRDSRAQYPGLSPESYRPTSAYPELSYRVNTSGEKNYIFEMVRNTLRDLGLDSANYGTADWNPLGDLVAPGAKIVLKPNWVYHLNQTGEGMECVITHPSLISALLEYVLLAEPRSVILGDAPVQSCNFIKLLEYGDIPGMVKEFQERGLPLELKDFRKTIMDNEGAKSREVTLLDPSDDILVDMGKRSALEPISKDWRRFRVTCYDPRKMWKHHRKGRHRYSIARDILEADLILNIPKLKTHKKTGVTGCLKNLVGINGNKEYLPHHRKGSGNGKGDAYASNTKEMARAEHYLDLEGCFLATKPELAAKFGNKAWVNHGENTRLHGFEQIEGSWYGNDTMWRTCIDLNNVVRYADASGVVQEKPQRVVLSIMDAIEAGQGTGPIATNPLPLKTIVASTTTLFGDYIGTLLLGFNPEKLSLVHKGSRFFMLDGRGDRYSHVKEESRKLITELGELPIASPAPGWEPLLDK